MTLIGVLTWAVLCAPPVSAVTGIWEQGDRVLTLEVDGVGTLEHAPLTWKFTARGAVVLSLRETEETLTCLLSSDRAAMFCRSDTAPRQLRLTKVGPRPAPVPVPPPPPCELHAVEGASAGPVRLGQGVKALAGLGLKPGPTAEWWVKPGYRVQVSPAAQTVVGVRVEGRVCLERDEALTGTCPFPSLNAGGTFTDCPQRGYRQVQSDRGAGGWIELFAPVPAGAATPECGVTVVPGVSAGPVRLGMSEAELARLGLGFWADELFQGKSIGPFMVTFDSKRRVTAVELGLNRAPCLDSHAVTAAWRPDGLCAHGFCGCAVARDSRAQGILRASCPQGIRFDFDAQPATLFGLAIVPPVAAPDAGSRR